MTGLSTSQQEMKMVKRIVLNTIHNVSLRANLHTRLTKETAERHFEIRSRGNARNRQDNAFITAPFNNMRTRYRQSNVRQFLRASDHCRARGNQKIKSLSTVQTK